MEHHVYFWLTDDAKHDAARKDFEQGLEALLEIQPSEGGMWGTPSPVAQRPVTDQSWDYGLSLRFASVADHDAYQAAPAHQEFIARHRAIWARVLVMDVG